MFCFFLFVAIFFFFFFFFFQAEDGIRDLYVTGVQTCALPILLERQTRELLARETHRDRWTVYVTPELVVEIAFSDLQVSSRYPGGLALRLARVKRYRDDKRPEDADDMGAVRRIYAAQGGQLPVNR